MSQIAYKRRVHLYGGLREKFGGPYDLRIHTPVEAIRALQANFKDFLPYIQDKQFKIVAGDRFKGMDIGIEELDFGLGKNDLHIVEIYEGHGGKGGVGKIVMGAALVVAAVFTAGSALAAAPALGATAAGSAVVGEAAMLAGYGASGAIASMSSLSIGGALATPMFGSIGAAFGLTAGKLLLTGAAMIFGGISSLLSPTPKVGKSEYGSRNSVDNVPSAVFNGPINVSEQGGPIPLVYGKMMVGTVVVSAGISTYDVKAEVA